MKFKNLLILLVLVAILLIAYSNSVGIYYSTSISSSWKNENSVVALDQKKNPSLSSCPVVVVYKTSRTGDVDARDPFVIDISDKELGSFWMPLIKSSGFKFSVDCSDPKEIKTPSAFGTSRINGKINVAGDFSFLGFCSQNTARKLVAEQVIKTIYTEAKKHIGKEEF
jgi:hypothetical protein